jgi:hypothetical protein
MCLSLAGPYRKQVQSVHMQGLKFSPKYPFISINQKTPYLKKSRDF